MSLIFTLLHVFSCPKNMDQCSQSIWDLRRWLCWQDTRPSKRLWSTMPRSLETEISIPYSMISTKEMVRKWCVRNFFLGNVFLLLSKEAHWIYFQVLYSPMVTLGKRWGVLLSLRWEILEWAKGSLKTKSLRNVVTWLKNLKNTKVKFSLQMKYV